MLSLLLLQGQTQLRTLDAYLDTVRTPNILALAPESVIKVSKEAGLEGYGRKLVKLGEINAVVPAKIAAFDDKFSQQPNLYDGLPREAKVLFLLTTLNPRQREIASRQGLSLQDCSGEQRDVFRSLLPKRIDWTKSQVTDGSGSGKKVSSGSVTGSDLEKVRLQIVRTLRVEVPLAGDDGGIAPTLTSWDPGAAGAVAVRRQIDDRERDELFGARLRYDADNVLKPGALDTKGLDTAVTLPKNPTLAEALVRIGQATHRELMADVRVSALKLRWKGGPARAGDLLDSLALAVGGTYRKVGGVYLLASDLLGAGARQVRFAAWESSIQGAIARKEDEWRGLLSKADAMRGVTYASDDKLAPDTALDQAIDASPNGEGRLVVRTADLPSPLQGFLKRMRDRNPTQRFNLDHVAIERSTVFRFVLPDGTPMGAEPADLGIDRHQNLDPVSARVGNGPRKGGGVKDLLDATLSQEGGTPLPVLFRTDSAADAEKAIAQAKARGVGEVWLETRNAQCLTRALASGVSVRLVLRPWTADSGTPASDLDRNLLGDDGTALAKRLATDPLFASRTGGPYPLPRPIGKVMAPGTSSWAARAQSLSSLARTPGLAGLVVLGTAPSGYEGKRNGWQSAGLPLVIPAACGLGYTETKRLEFLRRNGVDPIDLGWQELRGKFDLRPSFFPDNNLLDVRSEGPYMAVPAGFDRLLDAWDKSRGIANAAAMKAFVGALPPLPLEVEGRLDVLNMPELPYAIVRSYVPGTPWPIVPGGQPVSGTSDRIIAPVREDGFPGAASWAVIEAIRPNSPRPLTVIDFGALPAARLEYAITRFLPKARAR